MQYRAVASARPLPRPLFLKPLARPPIVHSDAPQLRQNPLRFFHFVTGPAVHSLASLLGRGQMEQKRDHIERPANRVCDCRDPPSFGGMPVVSLTLIFRLF